MESQRYVPEVKSPLEPLAVFFLGGLAGALLAIGITKLDERLQDSSRPSTSLSTERNYISCR